MEKKRLQFDFSGEALKELDDLQEQTGFSSRADLIRHALRLFQWAFDETQSKDAKILIEKNGQVREVMFPFWRGRKKEEADNEEEVFAGRFGHSGRS